jgi:hypothetical protein
MVTEGTAAPIWLAASRMAERLEYANLVMEQELFHGLWISIYPIVLQKDWLFPVSAC